MTLADLERLAIECKKHELPKPYYMYISIDQARFMWESIQKYYNIEFSLDEVMALGECVLVGDFMVCGNLMIMKLKEKEWNKKKFMLNLKR